jgi:hypothetical protein
VARELPVEQEILAEALDIASSRLLDEGAYELAVEILAVPRYAARISSGDLLGIVEVAPGGHVGWLVVRLVEAAHAHGGGLAAEKLRAIRDRWTTSPLADHRKQAVEVARLLVEPDIEWARTVTNDTDHEVRDAFARRARKLAGPSDICALLEARLAVERHRSVKAALHDTLASMLEERSFEEQRLREEIEL